MRLNKYDDKCIKIIDIFGNYSNGLLFELSEDQQG